MVYKQRMQIELSFRDMKSQHFGAGLECSRSKGTRRLTILVLIASLAAILLWLIGTTAERCGLHERMRPGSRKRLAYSRVFLARLLLTLEDCRTTLAELVDAIGPLVINGVKFETAVQEGCRVGAEYLASTVLRWDNGWNDDLPLIPAPAEF